MKKYLFLAVLFLSMSAFAANSNKAKKAATSAAPAQTNYVQLAAQLSQYGYANKSALSLIEAAQIVKENGITEVKIAKTSKNAPKLTGKKNGQITLDAAKLLADAKSLANNDAHLLALIDQVQNTQKRGAVGGPNYHSDNVNANSYDSYSCNFIAGQTAIVTVAGDGDTDLDLYIYDSNGNLIDSDTDYTDACVATWVPRWTGRFTIKIVNRGNVYNHYILRTN
jgi:hypothetical protein